MKPYYKNKYVTLYHADCLDILPELEPVDLILTDPPYGHNNNNNNDMIANREAIFGGKNKPKQVDESEYRPIANDGIEANELLQKCLPLWSSLLKPGACCCCCCGGGGPDPQFARWSLWLDEHIPFKQMIIWDKGPMGMGHHYRRSYETILVAQKPGAKCNWYDTTHKVENVIRPYMYGVKKIIPQSWQHPTQKPIELMECFIKWHTQENHTVLDPFLGSGTTALACMRRNRNCIGIELEEKHCENTAKRCESFEKGLTINEIEAEQQTFF